MKWWDWILCIPIGLSLLTQLRVGLSKLNFHKFKHNFRDTINTIYPTNDGVEDTEHFLLLCLSFDDQRRDLLAGIEELLRPFVQIANPSNDALTQLLLDGDKDLSYEMNRDILRLTLRFICETDRFHIFIFSYLNLLRRVALRQKPFFKGPSDKNLITIYN